MAAAKRLCYFYCNRSKGKFYWESMFVDLHMTNLGEQNNILDAPVSKIVSSKKGKIIIQNY